ncbi:MFS transporter [Rothia halotolerans]|uniref:MFS transporter n=1 Tax=Rothia halotolerans TaxID=405770 RepID=UPI00192D726B|nr:MFS transporter [Rothia halotolerans]
MPLTPPRSSRIPVPGRSAWIPVALTILAVAWGGNEFTPLLIMYREISDFSTLTVNILLGAYILGIIPALLIGGRLSDRIGRKPVLLPAAPISALGSAIMALLPGSVLALGAGRILCGAALGLVMAVGSTWVKELGDAAGERRPGVAARRSANPLTGGFLAGATVAGALAQWSPWPTTAPYLLHILLAVLAGVSLLRVPETRPRQEKAPKAASARVPSGLWAHFARSVLPIAPWVFVAGTVAQAVIPVVMAPAVGSLPIAFAALLAVIMMSTGLLGQAWARQLVAAYRNPIGLAMGFICVGLAAAAWAAASLRIELALAAGVVLGTGYGIALVTGLTEVQRITPDEHLGTVTAAYFSLTYVGFLAPALLSALAPWVPYPVSLLLGIVLAAACAAISLTARPRGGGHGRGGEA